MITTPEIVRSEAVATAVVHLTIPGRDMGRYMDPAIQEVIRAITSQGATILGPMFSYHLRRPSDTFDFEIGFPVSRPITPVGRVVNSRLPAAMVARAVHQGPYEGLAQAWQALQQWVRAQGGGEEGRFWERYLNNPDEVKDPALYRTELNWVQGEG